MIKFTYYGWIDGDKEYEWEIEDWIITHDDMWDDYDSFMDELENAFKWNKKNNSCHDMFWNVIKKIDKLTIIN